MLSKKRDQAIHKPIALVFLPTLKRILSRKDLFRVAVRCSNAIEEILPIALEASPCRFIASNRRQSQALAFLAAIEAALQSHKNDPRVDEARRR